MTSTPTRLLVALLAMAAFARSSPAQEKSDSPEGSSVKGVNPAENLSKFEILPKFSRIDADNDLSVSTVTLKFDRAIQGVFGVNVELPLARFDAPSGDDQGIGDLNLRGRRQFRDGRWTYIVGIEAVLPLGSADTLGSGKYQLNPSVVAVYAVSAQTFVAAVAKHAFSVAGKRSRADIVQGQYRVLVAHATKGGWWFLGDPQVSVDYDQGSRTQFSLDGEVGKMVGPRTGLWLHAGRRLAGSWHREDWSISGGVRFIFL